MIRHLARLTQPIAGDPQNLGIAVYAEPVGAGWRMPPARDQGFEGVACVDDAARAAIVFLRLQAHGEPNPPRHLARGLLRFVASMQSDDGRFANFIVDWDGRKNLDGPTSVLGGPWSARATHALAVGAVVLGDDDMADAARRGLAALDANDENLDVHAIAALAALELWRLTRTPADARRCRMICQTIAAGCVDDALRDHADLADVHLWGHLQEVALCEVGRTFGDDELIEIARRSADAVLIPALEHLARNSCQSFEAGCVAVGLDAVARATGLGMYADAARRAQAWFIGANAAQASVYDPHQGVVFDGIDANRVSVNAGAEASIEGANALLGTLCHPRGQGRAAIGIETRDHLRVRDRCPAPTYARVPAT
jgi:hypothetical protein